MKVILISGKSGSGKDTFASFAREELKNRNLRILTIHFADMVKEYAKLYYNWDGNKDKQGRQLLQYIGTDMVRKYYPNYWAELVAKFIAAAGKNDDFDVVLIPDLRFLNEYKKVKKYNKDCITIRINKLNDDGTFIFNPTLTEEQNQHPSECELDDYCCDYMINNCGTLEDLKINTMLILNNIYGG